MEDANSYLTPKGLAGLLDLSIWSIYRLVSDGRIPCYKFGKAIRFNKNEIDNWINSQHKPVIGEQS